MLEHEIVYVVQYSKRKYGTLSKAYCDEKEEAIEHAEDLKKNYGFKYVEIIKIIDTYEIGADGFKYHVSRKHEEVKF